MLSPQYCHACVFLVPRGTLDERLDMCPAQLPGPPAPRFFLTLPPSAKSSIKARGHHPSHRWGGSDCRFQACPSRKGLNWDLFLKVHNPPSLGSSNQKSELSAGGTGGVMLYRPWVIRQLFSAHFPLDHPAGDGVEKLICLK